MTKLNPDTAPKSGGGSDESRLSQSPRAIREGNADRSTSDDSPVTCPQREWPGAIDLQPR